MQQGALTGSGRADDRGEFPRLDAQTDGVESANPLFTHPVFLDDVGQFQHGGRPTLFLLSVAVTARVRLRRNRVGSSLSVPGPARDANAGPRVRRVRHAVRVVP